MGKIIDMVTGNLQEKQAYKQNEDRAKALPAEYASAYRDIKNYLFQTSGTISMKPLETLVDILSEASDNRRSVRDVTGADVAAFADELVRGEKSYRDVQATKLNAKFKD